jgi:ferredoxin
LDGLLARLDGWLARVLPEEWNPLVRTGQAANLMLLVATASGVLLLFWYSASVESAYASLAAIRGRTLGGWVRAVHRYSSDLLLLLVLLHAARMLFAARVTGARWLPWVTGIAMTVLIWFIGWTGYWLVWDQPAQQVAVASARFLDMLPLFGEPMSRLFVADRLVPSLLFFVVFFLHMLLPLLMAVGLALHLARLRKARLLPGRGLAIVLTAGVAVAALLAPAPLDEPARMAVKAAAFTVDAWYLTPLALALRLQHAGAWLALAIAVALAGALPWLLARRGARAAPASADARAGGEPWQAVVDPRRCHACTQCVQDCPYTAISMVPRTVGRGTETVARVDPARCVGCAVCIGSCDSTAMQLGWLDTRHAEGAIEAAAAAALAQQEPVWLALVAADCAAIGANGGTPDNLLPGYTVQSVPTAGWVRPQLVERLLRAGVAGVLVVRDGRGEAPAREGNQWVADRLTGARTPVFRPDRAGAGVWRVVDLLPGGLTELRRVAAAWRAGAQEASGWTGWRRAGACAACVMLVAALVTLAVGPSHLRVRNPAPAGPELVFSFKAFGDVTAGTLVDPAEDAGRPVHMRGRALAKPDRADVEVRLWVDGVAAARTFRAKGISRDGPALGAWRLPVEPGARQVAIEVLTGPDAPALRWEGVIDARARRLHVITFDPRTGFIVVDAG